MLGNLTKLYKCVAAVVLCCLASLPSMAQHVVTGNVTDAGSSSPLPGVSVLIKSTGRGTSTGLDGRYSIEIPAGETPVLVFSFMGYTSREIPVNGRSEINVTLEPDNQQLDEVVVTALGISREKKSLGYAAQEVDGEELSQVRQSNFVDALAGKVAGVTVTGSPSGVGGSSRITIRGDKSLNINANQPLFVVDGVPITNNLVGSSGREFQEVDYGNGAALVNPDDIASISVLKGANAAALYGSRAANGVVVITTKSGKGQKGIGISVNSSATYENALVLPDFQDVYGQGLNGEFAFADGAAGGIQDGVDESWGPRYEGQLIPQFDSPTSNGFRGGDINLVDDGVLGSPADMEMRGEIIPTPWVAQPDNIRNFYQTGSTYVNNIAFSGSNEAGDFRLSYTNLEQKGIVPNTDLSRNTFSLNAGYKFAEKLSARVSVNYVDGKSDNRPNLSYGTENINYLLFGWLGRQVNLDNLKDYWMPGMEDRQQFNYNYNYHDNPYFNLHENTNGLNNSRLYGNITLEYAFSNWLSLMLRTGTDYTNQLRSRQRAFSTQRFPFGSYREAKLQNEERNSDFLLSVNKALGDKLSLSANLGGNNRVVKGNFIDVSAPQLLIPGIYSLSNTRVPLVSEQSRVEEEVNSFYASAQLAYDNFLYLELTARNDWASSLTMPLGLEVSGESTNSYFYPSASLSAVLSEVASLPDWFSYAKLRLGVAQVGNDTDPYSFIQAYSPEDPYGNYRAFSETGRLPNYNLKPEISTSYELGADLRFLNNRLGVDFTYYNVRTRNQILNIPVSITSGYSSTVLNAGEIRNWGYELMLNAIPLQTPKGFRWNLNVNFSANRSKVLELANEEDDHENYIMANRYITVEAREGERMGGMYGLGYRRVEDPSSPYYGQVIYNNEGKPLPTETTVLLGNYNPDWLAGVQNSFSFKGVSLSFLLDIRQGGEVYSHTQTIGRETGSLTETLEGRASGYDLSQPGNGVVGQGVVEQPDGSYRPNDVKLPAREWHTSFTLGRSLLEGAIFDASYVKLREVRLGYQLPQKALGRLPVHEVRISLIARNLAVWSDVPHIDPETSSMSGGTIVPGVESMAIPSTRSYGLSLSFKL